MSVRNGSGFAGLLQDVKSGNVTSGYVESSTNNFSPGNNVYLDNTATGGKDAVVTVDQVTGKTVSSIESIKLRQLRLKSKKMLICLKGILLHKSC